MKNISLIAGALLTGALLTSCDKPNNAASSALDKPQVEQIVHDYLLAHPDILIQVSQKLQEQQMQQMQADAVKIINAESKTIFENTDSVVLGNPKGDVTLVEFFDYQCVHCSHMYPVIQDLIQKNPNLRVVLKEFPIFGGASQYAAMATLAAAKQGKAEALHDELFKSGLIEGKLTQAAVLKLAHKVGLNIKVLEKDMQDPSIKKEIDSNYQLARDLKIQGTPAFIVAPTANLVDGKITFIPGASSAEDLQAAVNKAK